jgi:uncharacterized protein YggU (UPF0235/DUF167 family)
VRLVVRVTPRAARDTVEGWAEDEAGRPLLRLRITAPPADGAANAAAAKLLARTLGLRASAVRLAAGGSSRIKTFEIEADEDWVRERLAMR